MLDTACVVGDSYTPTYCHARGHDPVLSVHFRLRGLEDSLELPVSESVQTRLQQNPCSLTQLAVPLHVTCDNAGFRTPRFIYSCSMALWTITHASTRVLVDQVAHNTQAPQSQALGLHGLVGGGYTHAVLGMMVL